MRSTLSLWILAFAITMGSAVYQRVTGPTYPLTGNLKVGGGEVAYRFDRSSGGSGDAPVRVTVADTSITGILQWKRFKTEDPVSFSRMQREGNTLVAWLPHQPPAGKLEYSVRLESGSQQHVLPPENPVVLRFKGDVPAAILIVHVLAMFGGMLLSTRTGLEFFRPSPNLRALTYWTIGFLLAGGMILGPIVQKYAFGAYWTGWPFGTDLTDNKTFAALIGWLVAAIAIRRSGRPAVWSLLAALLTLLVYLIPHSVLGSELDYRTIDKNTNSAPQSVLPHPPTEDYH